MRKENLKEQSFVDIYFSEIVKMPLLSREEEIFLSKKRQTLSNHEDGFRKKKTSRRKHRKLFRKNR